MTQYLENMKIGDTILFRGPNGRLFYPEPGTRAGRKNIPVVAPVIEHFWGVGPMDLSLKHPLHTRT